MVGKHLKLRKSPGSKLSAQIRIMFLQHHLKISHPQIIRSVLIMYSVIIFSQEIKCPHYSRKDREVPGRKVWVLFFKSLSGALLMETKSTAYEGLGAKALLSVLAAVSS